MNGGSGSGAAILDKARMATRGMAAGCPNFWPRMVIRKELAKRLCKCMPQPEFPKITLPGGMEELHHRLLLHPDDFLAGYAASTALMNQKNDVMAMEVVRGFTALPDCPKYFYFLEAEIAFRMQDFSSAWSTLQKYEPIAE